MRWLTQHITPTAVVVALSASLASGRAVASPPYGNSTTGPVVDLGYVQYQGVSNASNGYNVWYGIHYAASPAGQNRWQPPIEIESSNNYTASTVLDATMPAPQCVQGYPQWDIPQGFNPNPPTGVEDCLTLDVLTPSNPTSSSLPVMVEIHGGGYNQDGSLFYPGFALVNASAGNIVYVSMQYRLSVFGFLDSAAVRADGTGNAGLLDQRSALGWVQRHIAAFGGDPDQVTIAGGSAGGGSVMNQMIMYGGEANPPFRGAIAEYPWWQPYHDDTVLEDQYSELLSATGCTDIACLRGLPDSAINDASQVTFATGYGNKTYGFGDFYYGPSVDGTVILDLPSNEFKEGHFSKVPLLTDRDGYEGFYFSNQSQTTMAEETADLQQLWPNANSSFFTRLYELYPESAYNATFWDRSAIFGDFIIDCPTYYMATALSSAGLNVWKLIFNAGSQKHGATQPFIYGYVGDVGGNNITLSHILTDWFLSFVVHLDPNQQSFSGVAKPNWPTYQVPNDGGFQVMDVNYTQIGVIPDIDASPQCDFFHGQSYVVRN